MDDLEFPQFAQGDLSEELMNIAGLVSLAGMMGEARILLELLKEHAHDFMLHLNDDGDYCLHLPNIHGDNHGLVHDNLNHLLVAGMAHTLRYIHTIQSSASNN